MSLSERARNKVRGFFQRYGMRSIKRRMWNTEYFTGRWSCLDATPDDCVYRYIVKYANQGSILDLGCGAGNTGNELPEAAYQDLTGIDISDVAVEKAIERTQQFGRTSKNHYAQGDIVAYQPTQQFDVILFRESIYYVPFSKIKGMLERYSSFLGNGGVFIVRLYEYTGRYEEVPDIIEKNFHLVEKALFDDPRAAVIVFRPASASN